MKTKIKTTKKKTKAQLQLQEMAFVLVGLILFFALLLLFFAVFQQARIKSLAEEIRREETIAKLHSIANMPEFSCREAFCVSEESLLAFKNLDDVQKQKYYKMWDEAKIVLIKFERVFQGQIDMAQPTSPRSCDNINVLPNCDYHIIYNKTLEKNYEAHSTFIPMCYIANEKGIPISYCNIGKIIVGFELAR